MGEKYIAGLARPKRETNKTIEVALWTIPNFCSKN